MSAAASLKTASPPAVDRAFAILEEVARSSRGLRLPEMTRRLGLPKSSTHSLLVALERRRYLQRNAATGRYQFGPGIFTLANAGLKGMGLRELSYPILAALWRRTGLNVQMAIMDGDHAVLIEQIAEDGRIGAALLVGRAAGIALYSPGQDPGGVRTRGAMDAIRPGKWRSSPAQRQHHLLIQEVPRRSGHHAQAWLCSGRRRDGPGCALSRRSGFGPAGSVVAAISVSGSCLAVHADNAATLVKLLENAAAQIGKAVVRSATPMERPGRKPGTTTPGLIHAGLIHAGPGATSRRSFA